MKNLKSQVMQEEVRRLFELRSLGVPLDEDLLEEMGAACRGLEIYQAGTILENAVFDLDSGGTGYMLAVAIYNGSGQILRPQGPRLELAWPESHFRWLENPFGKVPREYTYSFPPPGPAGFDRDAVLNHRLRPGSKLYPGDWLEGLLLGVGQASVPDQYLNRQGLRMRLSILDGRGNRYPSDVILRVSREGQLRRQQLKGSPRSGRELFSKQAQPGRTRIRKVAA
jgi:hypothetical protein